MFAHDQIVLRSTGCMRWIAGPFFVVWLCGWGVGEAFLLNQLFPALEMGLAQVESFPAGTIFLAPFTLFWTFGGITAIVALLRAVAGFDRIRFESMEIAITKGWFGIGRTKRLRREDVRAIGLRSKDQALVAWLKESEFEISSLGTPEERRQAAERLRSRFSLPPPSSKLANVDARWQVDSIAGGLRIQRSKRERRGCGGCLVLVTLILAAIAAAQYFNGANASAVILTILASLLAVSSYAAFSARDVTDVTHGSVTRSHSFGPWKRQESVAMQRLEISTSRDSDGDETTIVNAVDATGRKLSIAQSINDPWTVIALAERVASVTRTPLRIPPDLRSR